MDNFKDTYDHSSEWYCIGYGNDYKSKKDEHCCSSFFKSIIELNYLHVGILVQSLQLQIVMILKSRVTLKIC